jgi:hypothetical protein
MKLYIIVLSLATTVSACMESKADTSPGRIEVKRPSELKIDRAYINHLYGPKNDPIKNWSEGMKQDADRKNGKGC